MCSECKSFSSGSSGRASKDKDKDDPPPDRLRDARVLDARMAADDDEVDPSITAVDSERGEGGAADVSRPATPNSRPASPTPPPPASQSRAARAARAEDNEPMLSDVLAGMAARGEAMPGMDDEDVLLQGDEERERDLNTVAVTAGRNRQKQKATQKKPTPKADTESDTDLPDPKRSKKSGEKGRDSADGKGRDSAGGKGRDSAGGKGRDSAGGSAGKGKRPREEVDLVSDDDDKDRAVGSRHTPVTVSQIYKDWCGNLLDDVRRRFQTLMFARDGYPLKTLSTHKKLNYKLVLRAANQIMSTKDYTSFQAQMDRAFRDSERS